jgi:hypothetical protein
MKFNLDFDKEIQIYQTDEGEWQDADSTCIDGYYYMVSIPSLMPFFFTENGDYLGCIGDWDWLRKGNIRPEDIFSGGEEPIEFRNKPEGEE